jgi:heme-degrading monooxygenase HmoA
MHARASHIGGAPENAEEGVANFRDRILPELKSMDGSRGAMLLVDRTSGNALAITLWEDESAMQASEERANAMRRDASDQMGAEGEARVERYEVAVFEPKGT